ncbi:MAG: hypothetical protein WAW85_12480 [Gordonia sp. (in: high G+C Gram-positive bacteria)]|uniref:hypothetical protein n=1 Tax=Gordonia sp. (in: high G+C Gram-positive bacteria) TaxID=84139 RepID=UPI003BB71A4E
MHLSATIAGLAAVLLLICWMGNLTAAVAAVITSNRAAVPDTAAGTAVARALSTSGDD